MTSYIKVLEDVKTIGRLPDADLDINGHNVDNKKKLSMHHFSN